MTLTEDVPFDARAIVNDFSAFCTLLLSYLQSVAEDGWALRTGSRDKDWTLHQLLAHLTAIAAMFNRAVQAAIYDGPLVTDGLDTRRHLATWNDTQIETRVRTAPAQLTQQLMGELSTAAERVQHLTPDEAMRTIYLGVYDDEVCVIDMLEWQLSHAGVIHAAQLTRPLDQPPLWTQYSPGMLNRQVDRFMRHLSAAYWSEYGDVQDVEINFQIEGEGGGAWFVIATPRGARYGTGSRENPRYVLHFDSPDTLFGIFTVHISIQDALTNNQIRITGDPIAAMQLLRLFSPSPPKV